MVWSLQHYVLVGGGLVVTALRIGGLWFDRYIITYWWAVVWSLLHYILVGGGLVVTTFHGKNECFLFVNMRIILCLTPRIDGRWLSEPVLNTVRSFLTLRTFP